MGASETLDERSFGQFRLSGPSRTLLREGQKIALRSRSFDLLSALVAAGGDVVSKDELMSQIWRGAIVDDNTLQVHVSMLRKALGEHVGSQRHIVTVPGRGYRFVEHPGERMSGAISRALPEKPSIAVMPFLNMGGDAEDEYFTDGIVEDIIAALSRMRWLFVIARNSSFTYKHRTVDAKQIGHDLGVRYLLEGSVRKSSDRIRIAGQLIDAVGGAQLWSHRFEGALKDVFALQDEVVASVVSRLVPKLEQVEIERAKRKPTQDLQAYDHYMRGLAHFHKEQREANADALREFYSAIERDPDFAPAYGMAAWCYSQRLRNGWVIDRAHERTETKRLAARAAELGSDDAVALCSAGNALVMVAHELDVGGALIDRSLELNSNLAIGWYAGAWVRVWRGEPDVAIEFAERGMRLSPVDPLFHAMEASVALSHFIAGRYEEAVSWAERAWREKGNYHGTIRILAASYAMARRQGEAEMIMTQMRAINPTLSLREVMEFVPLRRPDDRVRYFEALRMAGLSE